MPICSASKARRSRKRRFTLPLAIGGKLLVAVCLTCLCATAIIGWYYFGESNIRAISSNTAAWALTARWCCVPLLTGALGKVDVVWNMSDMFNGFMVMPNLLALFLLRKKCARLTSRLFGTKIGAADELSVEQHL